MPVKISDLLPKRIEIEVGNGKMDVGPINLESIVKLIQNFRDPILHLITTGSKGTPDYSGMLAQSPAMVVQLIAMGADAVGQEDDIAKLPFGVQVTAAATIWEASVPEPKKLVDVLSAVMGQMRPNQPAPSSPDTATP